MMTTRAEEGTAELDIRREHTSGRSGVWARRSSPADRAAHGKLAAVVQLERDLLGWIEAGGTVEELGAALERFVARGGSADDAIERLDAMRDRVDDEVDARIAEAIRALSRV